MTSPVPGRDTLEVRGRRDLARPVWLWEDDMVEAVSGGSGYPLIDIMWTMFVFFCWVIWFWLLITIFADLFRRDDTSGWAKAGWIVLLIVLPFIGILIYLISQSKNMAQRRLQESKAAQSQFDDYVRTVSADGHSSADQIAKGKQLLDSGAINQQEFDALKQKALA
jgi:Phospholipase_D-nuclease N-terminal